MTSHLTPLVMGIVLGIVASIAAMSVGLDRDRATGPVTLIAIAVFYVVFAVDANAGVITQTLIAGVFALAALVSYRTTLWIMVAGLATHGLYDLWAHTIDARTPDWWPGFCFGVDLVFAIAFALWLTTERLQARADSGASH